LRVISYCTLQSRIRFPPLCHFELLTLFEMGFVYESRAQMRLLDASAKKQRLKYSWRCHFNGVTAYIICTTVRTDVDLLQFPELAPDDSASCMYVHKPSLPQSRKKFPDFCYSYDAPIESHIHPSILFTQQGSGGSLKF
jgi:hypothetical protein